MEGATLKPKSKRKAFSMTNRAGMMLPLSRTIKVMRAEWKGAVTETAGVMFGAALDTVLAAVLMQCGQSAGPGQKIGMNEVQQAMRKSRQIRDILPTGVDAVQSAPKQTSAFGVGMVRKQLARV